MSALYLDLALEAPQNGATLILAGSEAKHAGTVNRLRVGEEILIANGRGLLISARVSAVQKDELSYLVESVEQQAETTPKVYLVQSLAKGGRDELAIQAATELGIAGIIPWQADRSIVRWDAQKQEKNIARWETIVQEAAKQSKNLWIPEVLPVLNSKEMMRELPAKRCIILEPRAAKRLSTLVQELSPSLSAAGSQNTEPIYLLVGPEGGISQSELNHFEEAGAQHARMGELVLRSSTAGPAALAVINSALGRW
ncbi:MAG: 16S rRNA (uracil(1498)-N(3))-methyltransferase [Microbacteriaceae bacterium]